MCATCRMVIDWKCQVVGYPGEVMTDMDYSIYPEGFYTVRTRARTGPLHVYLQPQLRFLTLFVDLSALERPSLRATRNGAACDVAKRHCRPPAMQQIPIYVEAQHSSQVGFAFNGAAAGVDASGGHRETGDRDGDRHPRRRRQPPRAVGHLLPQGGACTLFWRFESMFFFACAVVGGRDLHPAQVLRRGSAGILPHESGGPYEFGAAMPP